MEWRKAGGVGTDSFRNATEVPQAEGVEVLEWSGGKLAAWGPTVSETQRRYLKPEA